MYYIEKDNKIVLTDENFETLQSSKQLYPDYADLEIQEVEEGYVIYNFELMTVEEKEKREAQKERKRLNMLFMTGSDVERAIYKVKDMDFDDILAMVKDNPTIDAKALKIEFKANNFYRGNPYISQVGTLLGFTSEQMDRFFDTKDYHYLTTCKLTINPTPAEATVVINSEVVNEVIVPYGSIVDYVISCDGYKRKADVFEITKDKFLEVVLDEDTTDATESDIQDELDTTTSKSDETDTDILE